MRGSCLLFWVFLSTALAACACGLDVENGSTRDGAEVAFGMTPDQWHDLKGRISNLAPGTEYAQVVKALGKPHRDEAIAAKERVDAPVTGRILVYYFKQGTAGLVNDRVDIYVRLVFDQNNRLKYVSYNGLSRDESH